VLPADISIAGVMLNHVAVSAVITTSDIIPVKESVICSFLPTNVPVLNLNAVYDFKLANVISAHAAIAAMFVVE
jgi:hypothetical protein